MKLGGILERGCREFAKCSPVSVTVWCRNGLRDNGVTAFISAKGTTVISIEAGGAWDGTLADLVPGAPGMRTSNGR